MIVEPARVWNLPFLVGLFSVQVFACSCGFLGFEAACERAKAGQVVFLGTVSGVEPGPGDWNPRLYRFRVETIYRGLPPQTAEVVVDSQCGGPCGTEYKIHSRYLMFGSLSTGAAQVTSGMCSGSMLADRASEELRFLELRRRQEATNLVYGRVVQGATAATRPFRGEDAPVAGVEVTLRSVFHTVSQRTSATGDFWMESLPPGEYELSARLEPYAANPATQLVRVPAIGCVEVLPQLDARASIAGTLTSGDGQPASHQPVELQRKNRSGSWYTAPEFQSTTDANGRFRFASLPDGDYALRNAMGGDRAEVLHLAPGQSMTGLQFSLGETRTPR